MRRRSDGRNRRPGAAYIMARTSLVSRANRHRNLQLPQGAPSKRTGRSLVANALRSAQRNPNIRSFEPTRFSFQPHVRTGLSLKILTSERKLHPTSSDCRTIVSTCLQSLGDTDMKRFLAASLIATFAFITLADSAEACCHHRRHRRGNCSTCQTVAAAAPATCSECETSAPASCSECETSAPASMPAPTGPEPTPAPAAPAAPPPAPPAPARA